MDDKTIKELVDGLGPIDWVQMRLLASLPFERRLVPAMEAQAFIRAALRGAWQEKFPDLTPSELNMKILAYLTPIRLPKP